jgi:hypothetical protein
MQARDRLMGIPNYAGTNGVVPWPVEGDYVIKIKGSGKFQKILEKSKYS